MLGSIEQWFESRCKQAPQILLIIFFLTASLLFVLRSLLIEYPLCLPDELIYIFFSKFFRDWSILKENFFTSNMPNNAFFQMYHLLFGLGENSLLAARILNSILFSFSIFPLYAISRFFLRPFKALIVSLLCLAFPINSYISYFMPEIFYFLLFYFLIYVIILLSPYRYRLMLLSAAIIISLLSLVKPQANILLLPSIIIFSIIGFKTHRINTINLIIKLLLYFLIPFFIARFILLSMLYSSNYFTFGSIYDYLIKATANYLHYYNIVTIASLVMGHIYYMLTLWFIPIFTLIVIAYNINLQSLQLSGQIRLRHLAWLLTTYLLTIIFTTSLFTAAVSGLGPYEHASRLHGRYFNFLFPLLIICTFAATRDLEYRLNKRDCYIKYYYSALVISIFLMAKFLANKYTFGLVDYPELFWLNNLSSEALFIYLALGLSGSLFFVFSRSNRLHAYIAFLLLTLIMSSWYAVTEQVQMSKPSEHDRAGLVLKNFISGSDLASGYIIREPEDIKIFRTLYQLGIPVKYADIPATIEIIPQMIPKATKWLLILGTHRLGFEPKQSLCADDYKIIKLD